MRLFILSRFGFKDVKRGWLIAISFTESKVTVVHRRREASNEETTGVPNFEFSWEFSMTFTRKMDKLEHASFSIVNMNVAPTMNERSLATLRATVQDWFYPGTDAFPCLSLFPVATTPLIANASPIQASWMSAAVPSGSSKKDKKRKSLGSRTRDFLGRQIKHSSNTGPSIPTPEPPGPHVSISDTYSAVAISSTPTKSKPKLKTYLSSESGTTVPVDSISNDSGGSGSTTSGTVAFSTASVIVAASHSSVVASSVTIVDPATAKRANLVRRLSDSSEAVASNRRKSSFGYEGEGSAPSGPVAPTVSSGNPNPTGTPTKLKQRKSGNLTDGEETKDISKSKSKVRRSSENAQSSSIQSGSGAGVVSFGDTSASFAGQSTTQSTTQGIDIPTILTSSKKKKRGSESKVRSKRSKSIGSANSQTSILIDSVRETKEVKEAKTSSMQLQRGLSTPPLRSSADDVLSMEEDVDDEDFEGDQGLDESEKSMSWSTDSSWSSIETRSSNPNSAGSRKHRSRESRMRALSSDSEGRAPNLKLRHSIRSQTSVGSPSTPVLAQHSSPNFSAALTSQSVPDQGPSLASFSSPHFGPSSSINSGSNSLAAPAPTSPTAAKRRLEDIRHSSTTALLGSSGSLTLNSSSNTLPSSSGTPGSPTGSSDTSSRHGGKDDFSKEKTLTPTRKKSISSTTREGLYASTPSKERKDKDKAQK